MIGIDTLLYLGFALLIGILTGAAVS